ncbi:hypothetical protein BJV82DRAFT_712033 [Fennellomyces sp. T-0311]|nr:hypothetical protein BJV82DRAFT_712033 [Fennellomyces sp. T-0311]
MSRFSISAESAFVRQLFLDVLNMTLLQSRIPVSWKRSVVIQMPKNEDSVLPKIGILSHEYVLMRKHTTIYFRNTFKPVSFGDPLSALLFNLAIEPSLCAIPASPALPGFRFHVPGIASLPQTIGDALGFKALAYLDNILGYLDCPTAESKLDMPVGNKPATKPIISRIK